MFDEKVRNAMRDLQVLNYSPEAIQTFLQAFPMNQILTDFLETGLNLDLSKNLIIKDTVSRLLRDNDTFQMLLTEASSKEILQNFVTNKDEFYREIFAECLIQNVEVTKDILILYSDKQSDESIQGYIKIIYYLLRDRESQVGLKITKFIEKLSKLLSDTDQCDYLFFNDTSVELLSSYLQEDDAVVSIRTLETLIQAGNQCGRLYTVFQKLGYLDLGLDLYFKYSDDILEKLNLVDIIGKMGQTEQGAESFASHKAFGVIKKEALSKDTDPFVARSLGVLLIDLMNHKKVKYSFKLFKDLEKRLEFYLLEGFGEELHVCYDMISSFGKSFEGFSSIMKNKKVLQKLCILCHSNIDLESKKALRAIVGLLEPIKIVLTPNKQESEYTLQQVNIKKNQAVEFLLVYVGNPVYADSFIDIKNKMFIDGALEFFLKQLLLPFDDIEQVFLMILLRLFRIERILLRFCRNPQSLEYLHMKQAKDKTNFDLKTELKTSILTTLNEIKIREKEGEKFSFAVTYLEEYSKKAQQRKIELMQYATGTN